MADYEGFNEKRVKHLELIQAVITRLGNDGFLVKGWALTITVALLGFAVNSTNWRLALVALVPSLAFWGLDAYFLQAERLYRTLYDRVARETPGIEPFFMSATSDNFLRDLPEDVSRELVWHKTLRRPVLLRFYLALLVSVTVVALIMYNTDPSAR